MDTKFTYYDIVGFIIPGAVVLIILYWFATGFLTLPPTIIGVAIPDSIKVLIFIIAGYFLGHVVHAIGAALLRDREVMRNLYFEYFLDDTHYSRAYKNNLVQILNSTFPRLDWVTEVDGKSIKAIDIQQLKELFHLCHALIRKEGLSTNTDTREAIANMYRGLYACAWVSAIVCFVISLKQFLLLLAVQLLPGVLPNTPFFAYNWEQLVLGIFLTLLFIISARFLLRPRWSRYKEYYVDSIFTNLYVWYQTKQGGQTQQSQANEAG